MAMRQTVRFVDSSDWWEGLYHLVIVELTSPRLSGDIHSLLFISVSAHSRAMPSRMASRWTYSTWTTKIDKGRFSLCMSHGWHHPIPSHSMYFIRLTHLHFQSANVDRILVPSLMYSYRNLASLTTFSSLTNVDILLVIESSHGAAHAIRISQAQ